MNTSYLFYRVTIELIFPSMNPNLQVQVVRPGGFLYQANNILWNSNRPCCRVFGSLRNRPAGFPNRVCIIPPGDRNPGHRDPRASAAAEPTATEVLERTAAEVAAWEEDLVFFREQLVQIHPNPFWRVPEAEYDLALDELRDYLAGMTDTEIIVGLARIMAYIDGHSAISHFAEPANFQVHPLRMYLFSDGIYVSMLRSHMPKPSAGVSPRLRSFQ